MRIRRLALALAFVCLPTIAVAQTVTVARDVNLRNDPSTDNPPIRLLTPTEPPLILVDPTPTAGYYHVKTSAGEDGWVWGRNVVQTAAPIPAPTPPSPTPPTPTPAPAPAPPAPTPTPSPGTPGGFAGTNPACPPTGTHNQSGHSVAYDPTSDAGLRNEAKRHIPLAGTPRTLAFADFVTLQQDINTTFADASTTKTTFTPDRHGLQNVALGTEPISEGDLVQVSGFVTVARDEAAESVNCGGVDGNDIHINIGPQGATEFDGIVVEMIPQLPRPTGWDSTSLTRISTAQLAVLVVGGLTYDNEHLVNGDASHPKSGQPKRFALWEVHPITDFFVCVNPAGCDPAQHDGWQTLTAWANAHPISNDPH